MIHGVQLDIQLFELTKSFPENRFLFMLSARTLTLSSAVRKSSTRKKGNERRFARTQRENSATLNLIQPTYQGYEEKETACSTHNAQTLTQVSGRLPTLHMEEKGSARRIADSMRTNSIYLQSWTVLSLLSNTSENTATTTKSAVSATATTQMNGTRNIIYRSNGAIFPVIPILIPLTVVFVITLVIVLICFFKKRKRRKKKREESWKQNLESNISWLDAFEFPQTLRTLSDFSEHADFAIPMGPLHRNNFAFENFDTSATEKITEQFSKKRRTSGTCGYKSKKRADIYPIDDEVLSNHNDGEQCGKLTRI